MTTQSSYRHSARQCHEAAMGARPTYGYARISQDATHEGLGVERQSADIHATAEANGLPAIAEGHLILDNDVKASRFAKKLRPGFARLMKLAAAGEVGAIIVYDLTRYSRRPIELEALITVAEQGVNVYSHRSGPLRLDTPEGKLQARVQLAVAAHETDMTSQRLQDRVRHNAAAGVPTDGRPPFGWAKVRQPGSKLFAWVVVPEEAAIVAEMVRMAVDDRAPANAIARWANEQGHRTRSGNAWTHFTVFSTVTNPAHAGLRRHHDQLTEGAWEGFLSVDLHNRAVIAMDARRRTTRTSRASDVLLSGLVRCQACGEAGRNMTRTNQPTGRLTPEGEREYRIIWRCQRQLDGTGCGCNVDAKALEQIAEGVILEHLADARKLAAIAAPSVDTHAEWAQVREARKEWAARSADVDYEIWEARDRALRAKEERLRPKAVTSLADELSAEGRAALSDDRIVDAWKAGLDMASKRALARYVLASIWVARAPGRGGRFDPSRVDVRLTAEAMAALESL